MGSDPVETTYPRSATEQKGLTPLLQGLAPSRHGVFVRELRDRAHGLPHRGRPVRDPGDPALAGAALPGEPGRHGLRRQRQHHGHGRVRAARRLLLADASTAGSASSSAWRCSPSRRRCWRWRPASAPSPLLRIVQGVFMASAFTLTLAYLGEECSAADAAGAFAAYITGNVASNLIGRLISAALADHLGLAANFYVFALLNLAGAVLVYFTVHRARPHAGNGTAAAVAARDLGAAPAQRPRCAPASASASASCSPSSAPSPTSTSC